MINKIKTLIVFTIVIISSLLLSAPVFAAAGINPQFNYQGRLTNSSGANVSDGAYNFVFKLYTTSSGGSAIWTETWNTTTRFSSTVTGTPPSSGGTSVTYVNDATESYLAIGDVLYNTTANDEVIIESFDTGANTITISPTSKAWSASDAITTRIAVRSGLFSARLGSISSLSSINLNQTPLYLGVAVGADSEMTPRKRITSVLQSFQANKLDGYLTSTSTSAGTEYGSTLTISDTGIVTTGTDTTYGLNISTTRTGATGGTIDTYGLYSAVTADVAGAGTSTAVGGYFSATGADNNYGLIVANGSVGIGTVSPNNRLEILSTTTPQMRVAYDTSNYATIAVASNGAATIDATGAGAAFSFSDAASFPAGATITCTGCITDTNVVDTITASNYLPLAGGTLTGNLLFSADNTYDIGASGATRPRTGYFGTSVVVGSTTTVTTNAVNFSSAATMSLANATNALNIDSDTFVVDALNNRVGIGTNAPSTALDLNGAFSVRGMSAPSVSPSGQGRIYYDSTANKFKISENGGAYGDLVGDAGAVTWKMIYENNLTSAATSVTVSGLDGNTDVEYMVVARIIGGSTTDIYIRPNNDSGSNYGYQYVKGNVSTASAERNTSTTSFHFGSANAGEIILSKGLLYAKSGYARTFDGEVLDVASGTTIGDVYLLNGIWSNTTDNITSLVFYATTASGLGVGTHIEVWARRTGGGSVWALNGNSAYYTSGSVGVGLNNPSHKLQITDTDTTASRAGLYVAQSGAISGTGYGGYFTKTGASTTNIAGYFSATGATNNYGLIVENGNVGIGTTAPNTALDLNGALSTRGMSAPSVSPSGQGRIYYDSTANKFKISENGGAYADLLAGSNWNTVQAAASADFSIAPSTSFTARPGVSATITISGTKVLVSVSCSWYGPSGYTTLTSRINRDSGSAYIALSSLANGNGSNSVNIKAFSGGSYLFTGLSSGSHTFSYEVATDAGANTWYNNASSAGGEQSCYIRAEEISGASSGGWADDGTVVRLSTNTDNVGVGTSSPGTYTKLNVSQTDATASQTRYGLYSTATGAGATSTNVAGYFSATGATNNYGLIVENGNVGIGTTAPGAKLEVNGGNLRILRSDTTPQLILANTVNGTLLGQINNINTGASTGYMQFTDSNGTPIMNLSGGSVGIGTTSPAARLTVRGLGTDANGFYRIESTAGYYRSIYMGSGSDVYFNDGINNAYLSTAGVWTDASDVSIKTDIKDLSKYGLSTVLLLKPREYKMKVGGEEQIGFIAQEVNEIIPEVVSTTPEGKMGLAYGHLTAVLTKAIKELDAKLNSLAASPSLRVRQPADEAISGGNSSGIASSSAEGGSPRNGANYWLINSSGRLTSTVNLDLGGKSIYNIGGIFSQSGKWKLDENGYLEIEKIVAKEVETEKLKIGALNLPAGITLYDLLTKEPYCLYIENGEIKKQAGECQQNNLQPTTNNLQQGAGENNLQQTTDEQRQEQQTTGENLQPITDSTSTKTAAPAQQEINNSQPTTLEPATASGQPLTGQATDNSQQGAGNQPANANSETAPSSVPQPEPETSAEPAPSSAP